MNLIVVGASPCSHILFSVTLTTSFSEASEFSA